MAKVIIYTTPSCVYCKSAKAFFAENNVAYEEKNVAEDLKARDEMVKKSGMMAVPVIDVAGTVVIGFDKQKLSELLGIKK
ncbi:MAG: glutathione S-transferase N-terminal domain-containing protein [Candidatus Wildermuthbacteria bacterium]|nr:glutathione S-transferase N-terminal domain-containing protein [Candidatus Wildermuthbacteria bacterium]